MNFFTARKTNGFQRISVLFVISLLIFLLVPNVEASTLAASPTEETTSVSNETESTTFEITTVKSTTATITQVSVETTTDEPTTVNTTVAETTTVNEETSGDSKSLSEIPEYTLNLMNDLGIKDSEKNDFYNRIKEVCIKTAYLESRGEPYEGQVAVIATILNRLKSSNYSNTPEEVVRGQYADYSTVSWEDVSKCPKLEKALNAALSGEDPTREHLNGLGALFFYNPKYCSQEALQERSNISVDYRIGSHVFYAEWK